MTLSSQGLQRCRGLSEGQVAPAQLRISRMLSVLQLIRATVNTLFTVETNILVNSQIYSLILYLTFLPLSSIIDIELYLYSLQFYIRKGAISMKNIFAVGYTYKNESICKYHFDMLDEIIAKDVIGKSLVDFIWIDSSVITVLFEKIRLQFYKDIESGMMPNDIMDDLLDTAGDIALKNSYLMIYSALFISYLIKTISNKDNAIDEIERMLNINFKLTNNRIKNHELVMKNLIDHYTTTRQNAEQAVNDLYNGNPINTYSADNNSLYNSKFKVFYEKENDSLTEMHELSTITGILRFDIMQMVKNNTELKICRHCNLPFITKGRADSAYCDRIANGETKPCNEIGALNVFKSNHENDKIFKAYQKAYRRMDSRKRMKTISPEEFKSWGKQARALRKDCYNGKLTFEEYVVWLEG